MNSAGSSHTLARISFILVAPASIIVSFGLMNEVGFSTPNDWLDNLIRTSALAKVAFDLILHPLLVLGGLLFVFFANIIPLVRLNFSGESLSVIATVTIKDHARNALFVAYTLFLSGTVLTYAFFENFRIIPK